MRVFNFSIFFALFFIVSSSDEYLIKELSSEFSLIDHESSLHQCEIDNNSSEKGSKHFAINKQIIKIVHFRSYWENEQKN